MVNCEELIDTTECLSLYTRVRMYRCRYKRVRLYLRTPTYVHNKIVSYT